MHTPRIIAGVLCSILVAAGETSAQQSARTLLTVLGHDTVAVENIQRTATGFRADVVLRAPRTTLKSYDVRVSPEGRPLSMTVQTYDPARGLSTAATQTAEVDLAAGSGIPFIDMVHWPFELMLRRAIDAATDTLTISLVSGTRTLPFRMERLGGNRYTAAHPSRGVMDLEASQQGSLAVLDAGKTTRALRVTPGTHADISALAAEYAARDGAGRGMGELSGRGEVSTMVHGAEFLVDYGRPLKRGRDIFGGLLPFGSVWRTGANHATHLTTSHALRFGDQTLPAGTYTLFTIPGADQWTLMINRRTNINGQNYDATQDVMRLPMTVRALPSVVEPFTILVEPDGADGVLRLQWDRTDAVIRFTVVR